MLSDINLIKVKIYVKLSVKEKYIRCYHHVKNFSAACL